MTAKDLLPQEALVPPAAANEVDLDALPPELTPTTRPVVGEAFDPRSSFFPPGLMPDRVPEPMITRLPARRKWPFAIVGAALVLLVAAAVWDLLKGSRAPALPAQAGASAPAGNTRIEGVVTKASPAAPQAASAPASTAPLPKAGIVIPVPPAPAIAPASRAEIPSSGAAAVVAAPTSTVTHTKGAHASTAPATPEAVADPVATRPAPSRARPANTTNGAPVPAPPPENRNCDAALKALGLC
jgi:hypothetical protein